MSFGKVFLVAMFWISTLGGVAWGEDFSEVLSDRSAFNERNSFCERWYDNPNQCDRTAGCEFDWYSRECKQRNVVPGPSHCSWWDNNPRRCSGEPGCQWDHWNQRCDETRQGDDHPANQCWRYDRDPQTCNVMRGCHWDNWNGRCTNGDTGSRPHRVTIRCSSNGWSQEECWVGGTVVSAHLQREWSHGNRCVQGHTWGSFRDSIWVDRGCSADFVVTIRR